MASELLYVLKNKNKFEKEERKRKAAEMSDMRETGIYRVALNKQLELINLMLDDPSIKYIDINIPDNQLVNFGNAIGFEEMRAFDIKQLSPNEYRIARELINI